MPASTVRVNAYIDGFSVYYGFKSKGWRRYLWLDYRALLAKLVRPPQTLGSVKYFTSRVRKPEDSRIRQGNYLDALKAAGGVEIVEGKYDDRPNRCPDCGHKWARAKEKMTDVQLAISLVMDAADDQYDTAFLVCADADLVPAVVMAQERFDRKVVVISPPGRHSDELASKGVANLRMRRSWLNQSQLPDPVTDADGRTYQRPTHWT